MTTTLIKEFKRRLAILVHSDDMPLHFVNDWLDTNPIDAADNANTELDSLIQMVADLIVPAEVVTTDKIVWSRDSDAHIAEIYKSDKSVLTVFVDPCAMIMVCESDKAEFMRRLETDDIDSYEAYDMCDGEPYYLHSVHAIDICRTLMYIDAHR